MAKQTTNYNLVKPSYDENADIAVINGNMDIIDTKMKEIDDKTNSNSVEWNQLVNSGTKIAEITVGGNKKDVYAPEGGGGSGGSIVVDSELSETSENPVQNKVISSKINELNNNFEALRNYYIAYATAKAYSSGQAVMSITIPKGRYLLFAYNHNQNGSSLWLNGVTDQNSGAYCCLAYDSCLSMIMTPSGTSTISFVNLNGSNVTMNSSSYIGAIRLGDF